MELYSYILYTFFVLFLSVNLYRHFQYSPVKHQTAQRFGYVQEMTLERPKLVIFMRKIKPACSLVTWLRFLIHFTDMFVISTLISERRSLFHWYVSKLLIMQIQQMSNGTKSPNSALHKRRVCTRQSVSSETCHSGQMPDPLQLPPPLTVSTLTLQTKPSWGTDHWSITKWGHFIWSDQVISLCNSQLMSAL